MLCTWLASHFKLYLPPALETVSSKWIQHSWNFFERLPKPIWLWLWATKNWRKKKNLNSNNKVIGNGAFHIFLKKILQVVPTSQMKVNKRPWPPRKRSKVSNLPALPDFLCELHGWDAQLHKQREPVQDGPPLEALWERAFQKNRHVNRDPDRMIIEQQRGWCVLWWAWLDYKTRMLGSWQRALTSPCYTHKHKEGAGQPVPVIPGLSRLIGGSLYFS